MAGAGIWLPGKTVPPAAKLISGPPMPEKSPARCCALGTVAEVVSPWRLRKPS